MFLAIWVDQQIEPCVKEKSACGNIKRVDVELTYKYKIFIT